MRYKMCVWDLDGTLLNTLPGLHYYDNETLKHFGFNTISYEDSIGLIKYPLGQYYQNLLRLGGCPEEKIDDIVDELTDYDFNIYREDPLYLLEEFPGVRETLRGLKEEGVVNAVFSNKFEEICIASVSHFYREYVTYIFGQTADSISKPKKGCTDRLIEASGFSKEEILIIGDTEVDMLTARNNDIDCLAVTWGYQDIDVLKTYDPEYIVSDPREIVNIIKEN